MFFVRDRACPGALHEVFRSALACNGAPSSASTNKQRHELIGGGHVAGSRESSPWKLLKRPTASPFILGLVPALGFDLRLERRHGFDLGFEKTRPIRQS